MRAYADQICAADTFDVSEDDLDPEVDVDEDADDEDVDDLDDEPIGDE